MTLGKRYIAAWLVTVLLALSISLANAQTISTISGSILDESNQPIPFVHVSLERTGYGTVTNLNGEFTLNIPSSAYDKNLVTSCIGYVSRKVLVKSGVTSYMIVLKESIQELDNIVVTPKDDAREIVKLAIENIPANYPTEPTSMEAFIRISTSQDSLGLKPFYIIEGLFEANKEDYSKPRDKGTIKLLQSRKFEFSRIDSLELRFYGSAHSIHWADMVMRRDGPLDSKKSDKYNFQIEDVLWYDNELLYKIQFDSKDNGRGCLYILENAFAIRKIDLSYNQNELKSLVDNLRLSGYKRESQKYVVEYVKSGNNWNISSLEYTTMFLGNNQKSIYSRDVVSVSNVKSEFAQIPYANRLGFSEIVLQKVGQYDSAFWQGDNIIQPDANLKAAMRTNELRSPDGEKTKREKFIEVFQRFRINYGIGLSQSYSSSGNIQFDDLTVNPTFQNGRKDIPTFQQGVSYELSNNFMIGMEALTSFKERRLGELLMTLAWEKNLTPKSRPLYISFILKSGIRRAYNFLETVDNPNPVKLEGKDFDSKRIDVYRGVRSASVIPTVRLSFEVSKRVRPYVSFGREYLFAVNQGLLLVEDDSFFKRKQAFVTSSGDERTISGNSARKSRSLLMMGVTLTY